MASADSSRKHRGEPSNTAQDYNGGHGWPHFWLELMPYENPRPTG